MKSAFRCSKLFHLLDLMRNGFRVHLKSVQNLHVKCTGADVQLPIGSDNFPTGLHFSPTVACEGAIKTSLRVSGRVAYPRLPLGREVDLHFSIHDGFLRVQDACQISLHAAGCVYEDS